jgi:hypothetical protein
VSLLCHPPQIKLREECADVVGHTNCSVNQASDSNNPWFHESVHLVWCRLRGLSDYRDCIAGSFCHIQGRELELESFRLMSRVEYKASFAVTLALLAPFGIPGAVARRLSSIPFFFMQVNTMFQNVSFISLRRGVSAAIGVLSVKDCVNDQQAFQA